MRSHLVCSGALGGPQTGPGVPAVEVEHCRPPPSRSQPPRLVRHVLHIIDGGGSTSSPVRE
jgi:hypothetical protein